MDPGMEHGGGCFSNLLLKWGRKTEITPQSSSGQGGVKKATVPSVFCIMRSTSTGYLVMR